jgi:ADP-heptose:LPS heptosyltransferase
MRETRKLASWTPPIRRRDGRPRILLLAMLPIGDTVFTTPTIRALRARYPHARIVALTHTAGAPVLRCVPEVDEVRVLPVMSDWAGPLKLARTLRHLRALQFDAAIDFTTPAYKWISLYCRIPVRTYMKFDLGWWLLPGQHRHWRATHATEHYYNCARELDLPAWSSVSHQPQLTLPPAARRQARTFLRARGVCPTHQPIVAMHPGGTGLGGVKRWPAERFATVAGRLRADWAAYVVLLGGPDEVTVAETVAGLTDVPPPEDALVLPVPEDALESTSDDADAAPPVVAAGKLPLLATAALIEAADLFVGNDSSLLHLAATLGTPYVGIYGPTHLRNFQPIPARPRQGRCALPEWPCFSPRYFVGGDHALSGPCCETTCAALETISAARVFDLADGLLRERFAEPAETEEVAGMV